MPPRSPNMVLEFSEKRRKKIARRDAEKMADLGKRQQLSRNFGFLSMLGFTSTMLCTWEACLYSNYTALHDAGPVGYLYGFIFNVVGSFCTCASLAELASMAPTSGGQYHWVALLAPKRHKVFLSWFTGWMCLVGWIALVASAIYLSATITQGIVKIKFETFDIIRWQSTLIFWGVLLLCLFVNTVLANVLPKIEGFVLIFHILGFFAILIPLLHLAPRSDPDFVFTYQANYSGWSQNGTAWFVGLISGVFTLLGYDGPCHMAEEVQDAARVVPWTMIFTFLVNGLLGLGMVIAYLFSISSLDDVLRTGTQYNFIQAFYNATQDDGGTISMSTIVLVLGTCADIGLMASASRMTWAFARDEGLPFSNWLSHVSGRFALPLRAIGLVCVVNVLLSLIIIGSTAAFVSITSVAVAGLSISYFVPILLLFVKRCKRERIDHGPFHLGWASYPINLWALIYLVISSLFSFFPPNLPVTAGNMNYSCAVFGLAVFIGMLYWFTWGKTTYVGPIVEQEIVITSKRSRSTF